MRSRPAHKARWFAIKRAQRAATDSHFSVVVLFDLPFIQIIPKRHLEGRKRGPRFQCPIHARCW